jgi:uncharacterized protein
MRIVLAFAFYFAAVFLAGALLAPWLYYAVQAGAESFPALQRLAENPFHRFVHRSLMIVGVAGLWPLLRVAQIRSGAALGFYPRDQAMGRLAKGFVFGFVCLAVVAVLALALGGREWREDMALAALRNHLIKATLAALVVAFIEELFFRGVLFGGLRRALGWRTALILSAAIYALVHFFQRPPPPEAVYWWSGVASLGLMFRGFLELETLAPGFFTLMVAGLMLGWAYQKTGALYFSMGLHAGWIFWLKSYNYISQPGVGSPWFWGTSKLVDGWMALAALALLWGLLASSNLLKFGASQDPGIPSSAEDGDFLPRPARGKERGS